ncbi:MAG TPA: phosphotransferase [Streptosporangiaceae bacterium]|nr:phosphotransferase [Streptosporangiaceae bacterium]
MSRDDVLDLPPADVAKILRLHYGVAADAIEVVSGEIATVCRVASGSRLLAFKAIPAPGDTASLIRWQTSAMIKLARQGLPVPAVQPDIDGQPLVELPMSGSQILIQVSEWLTDPPLLDVPVDPPLLRAVGETAARVNLALSEFAPPPAPTRHPWELIRTGDTVRGLVDQVREPRLAALAHRALAVFDHDLVPLLGGVPWTVLHHDLHDSNLLVGEGPRGGRVVSGILDFGDMTYGPRLAELAVAATYGARNSADPEPALLDVAAGWAAVCPVTSPESLGLLPAVISRLATNVTVWASRMSGPRAQYARNRMAGADETLDALLGTDPAEFLGELRDRVRIGDDEKDPRKYLCQML